MLLGKVTCIRPLMVFFTSSIDGLRLGSLSQQRVIRVSMGLGRSLISGGRVPAAGNVQIRFLVTVWCRTGDAHWWRLPPCAATGWLTSVDGPHDAEGGSADLVVGLLAGDDLPQDDGPAEHVTLLAVVAACRKQLSLYWLAQ